MRRGARLTDCADRGFCTDEVVKARAKGTPVSAVAILILKHCGAKLCWARLSRELKITVEVINDADGACVGQQAKINLDLRLRLQALKSCGGGLSDFQEPSIFDVL